MARTIGVTRPDVKRYINQAVKYIIVGGTKPQIPSQLKYHPDVYAQVLSQIRLKVESEVIHVIRRQKNIGL